MPVISMKSLALRQSVKNEKPEHNSGFLSILMLLSLLRPWIVLK